MLTLIHILSNFQHDTDTDTEAWEGAFAEAAASHMTNAELVLDHEEYEIRPWREGDDENDRVEGIEWDIRPPRAAEGTSYTRGEWYYVGGDTARHLLHGQAKFESAWTAALNAALAAS